MNLDKKCVIFINAKIKIAQNYQYKVKRIENVYKIFEKDVYKKINKRYNNFINKIV